ncbi:MAG TPA: 1-(5-phosphoribosyl)-5-[(5-phosphoribosylamino)methylideneamino] imidazole-4-carboxamide isomerase [Gemmatimonadales bacterium]|nr:1-(5-phosphoribosyl)-5-[(5-phosphoribosylamino)methylideneamino] imidazole-4-carboxamide isomerase [Gemmatimonadales bacterium]
MDLFPAVDVRGGRVAHVRTGNASPPSVYGDDPVGAVVRLAAAGARWIHLVDLDRAYGRGSNGAVVQAVLSSATLRVQVGGSLADEETIALMLEGGATRVVIGCAAAANDPAIVGRLVKQHGPDRLAVAIDATDGRITPRDHRPTAPLLALDLARLVSDQGAQTIIYTDVTRDGTLAGPDLAGAQAIARLGVQVVASGGIGTLADLTAVRDAGLAGAVVGRALHEGRFTLAEALTCAAG